MKKNLVRPSPILIPNTITEPSERTQSDDVRLITTFDRECRARLIYNRLRWVKNVYGVLTTALDIPIKLGDDNIGYFHCILQHDTSKMTLSSMRFRGTVGSSIPFMSLVLTFSYYAHLLGVSINLEFMYAVIETDNFPVTRAFCVDPWHSQPSQDFLHLFVRYV